MSVKPLSVLNFLVASFAVVAFLAPSPFLNVGFFGVVFQNAFEFTATSSSIDWEKAGTIAILFVYSSFFYDLAFGTSDRAKQFRKESPGVTKLLACLLGGFTLSVSVVAAGNLVFSAFTEQQLLSTVEKTFYNNRILMIGVGIILPSFLLFPRFFNLLYSAAFLVFLSNLAYSYLQYSPYSPENNGEVSRRVGTVPDPLGIASESLFGRVKAIYQEGRRIDDQLSAPSNCERSIGYLSDFVCISVLFGTNRDAELGKPQTLFGSQLAKDSNALGQVVVTVPRVREYGGEIPVLKRSRHSITDKDRRAAFTIWSAENFNESQFRNITRELLADESAYGNQAFVFVHGFNVSFRDAAFRTAQIKYDLNFRGPAFFYSWPATGGPNGLQYYDSDRSKADRSVDNLVDFLLLVRNSVSPDTKINIISHSMGGYLLTQALREYARVEDIANSQTPPPFSNIIFAHADIDRERFSYWMSSAWRVGDYYTIYASGYDDALRGSTFLMTLGAPTTEDNPKIGFVSTEYGPSIFRDVFTVEITEIAREGLFGFVGVDHNTYIEAPETVGDLIKLLRVSPHPESRDARFKRACYQGQAYWIFDVRNRFGDQQCPHLES